VLGGGGIIVESDGLAQRRLDPSEHRQRDRNGLGSALFGEARTAAFVTTREITPQLLGLLGDR
jgi:hypothetical protein